MSRFHWADCRCAIFERVTSTMATKAMARLAEIDPESYRRILAEQEEHGARLRAACAAGNHGPQEKP